MTYFGDEGKPPIDEACPRLFFLAYAPTLLHRSIGRLGQYALGPPACDEGLL